MKIMFTPLPMASEVGLAVAFAALDGFIPQGYARAVGSFNRIADQAAAKRRGGIVPDYAAIDADVREFLGGQGDEQGLALLDVGIGLWQEHRAAVQQALDAEQARTRWVARRLVENTPGNRRQARAASQAAGHLVPPAVAVADRTASTINDASQGVMTPPSSTPPDRRYPSWA